MLISSQATSGLPDPQTLRRVAQAVAMLDAILMPEWIWRYYTFQAHWDDEIDLFSMRDGEGNEFYIVFQDSGVLIKGFAPESPVSSYRTNPPSVLPGLLEGLPSSLQPLLNEPALAFDEITFCLWREKHDSQWWHGDLSKLPTDVSDGSEELLSILDGNPVTYYEWSTKYYGRSLPLENIQAIYQHMPLSESLIQQLNVKAAMSQVRDEAGSIGYGL